MIRKHGYIPGILFYLFFFFAFPSREVSAQNYYSLAAPVENANIKYDISTLSYNDFYQNLAPYGQWIEDNDYGYVWSPDVDADFRPYYTNGYWAMTDYGNTWVSDYPWGWACFHYGRWTFDSYYGWLWIPGQNWGPAWVCWRDGNGFYGWAPLSPGYKLKSKTDYKCPNDWWVFLPAGYIYSATYYHYWAGPRNNKDIIHNSEVVNNTYENNGIACVSGPQTKQVEEITKHPVHIFKLTNSNNLNTKVHLDGIKMYRPSVIKEVAAINGQKIAPPNVIKAPNPVSRPQSVTASQNTEPEFRKNLSKTTPPDAAGTHFPEPAKPSAPQQGSNNNPYQWDAK